MAGIAHEDVAELLTDIIAEIHGSLEANPHTVITYLRIASVVTDFVGERSDGFGELYDQKLIRKLNISD
jgi:hypothetical protein